MSPLAYLVNGERVFSDAAYRELVDAATRRLNADPNRDAILAKQKAARLRNHLRLHRITRGPFIHNGRKPTHRKARP